MKKLDDGEKLEGLLENLKKLEKLEKLEKLKKLKKLEKLENLEKLEKLEKLELLEELDYSKFFGHYSKSRRPDDHGVFSVMMRGVGGQALFREKSDYISFLKILNKLLHRYSAVLYGFILMTNHVHFLVRTFGGAAAAGVGAAAAGVGCGHGGVGAAVDAGVGCGPAGVGAAVDAGVGCGHAGVGGAVDAGTFVSVAAAEEDVRKMFANLVTGYTGYYSRKYRTKGRLIYYPPEFSEKWRLDWQLKEIMYFINNPVLAGLSKSPGGYLWSSYSFYKELKSPLAKYIDVDASLIKDNFHSIRDFYLAIRSKKAFEKRMSKYK